MARLVRKLGITRGCLKFFMSKRKCPYCKKQTRDDLSYCDWCLKTFPENQDRIKAKLKWNSEADEHNQWDALGSDEKEEFIGTMKNNDRV